MEEPFAVSKGVSPGLEEREGDGGMSLKGMETILSLDCRSFGFLDFTDSSSEAVGVNFVSKEFVRKGISLLRKQCQSDDCLVGHKCDLLCHIGHLHLLLEEYNEAMSSYQQYSSLCPDTSCNSSYYYGLGLIYFTFGQDEWAVKAFRKVLSISPNFARLSEVYVRLGIIYKLQQEYALAIEHFMLALNNPGPCSMNKLEIHFHLGYTHHLRGDYHMTKLEFEGILASKNVPSVIKANTLRQLGWLYHTVPQVATEREDPHMKAVELLKLAVGANPGNGLTWYFLGRCHAEQGQFKEAFLAYRQSVSKHENQPDTWCAIGILYQQMGQARDSLQAYIRAVYYDTGHATTWIDMGLLYESCGQLLDSVLCYKNGLVAVDKQSSFVINGNTSSRDVLIGRLTAVEQQIAHTGGMPAHVNKSRILPSLLEAWTCLIPQSLRANHPATDTPILYLSMPDISSSPFPPAPAPHSLLPSPTFRIGPPPVKKQKQSRSKDPIIMRTMNDGWVHSPANSSSQFDGSGVADLPSSPYSSPSLPGGLPNGNGFSLPMDSQNSFASVSSPPQPFPQQLSSMDNSLSLHLDGSSSADNPYPSFTGYNHTTQPHLLPNSNFYSSSLPFSNPVSHNGGHLSTSVGLCDSVSSQQLLPTATRGQVSSGSEVLHSSRSSLSDSVHTIDYCPNPVVNGPQAMPLQPSTGSVVPEVDPSLPHDLHFVDPLNLGIRMEDYLRETDHGNSSASLHKPATAGIKSRLPSRYSDPQKKKEPRKRTKAQKGNPSMLVACSPLCLSPTSNDSNSVDIVPSEPAKNGSTANRPTSLVHFPEKSVSTTSTLSPAQVSNSQPSQPQPKRQPETDSHPTLCSGNASDTSSGVSSAGTKLSSTSPHSSPSPTSSTTTSGNTSPVVERETPSYITPIPEPNPGLGDRKEYMNQNPFFPPSPPLADSAINLHPEVPVYEVSSYEPPVGGDLHKYCTNSSVPICVIRGLVEATGFDLNLFTTSTLMKRFGDHEVEVREQLLQAADENWDSLGKRQVWRCESTKSVTTVKEYGDYQREVMAEQHKPEWTRKIRGQARGFKMLRFGTNCDLSDKDKWKDQLDEIYKLPTFLRVDCPEANFLNHIGHTVLGMNSVQLYMKVPGCRTPGHQENNSFCSVNINIGPGDCEWFAVSNEYWGVIHELCELRKISFLVGSWWPILEELEQRKVPVYRFTQYPGEVVWINPGTVHWVQANSCCNNVAWNNGPLTAHQFRLAWERYQWNKIQKVRSIVPMITLSWTLARKVKITDPNLLQQIRTLLESSYKQCLVLEKQFQDSGTPIVWHGHIEGEPTPYCAQCAEEVFNFLFVVTKRTKEHLVYCHKCIHSITGNTRKSNPFKVLQQYSMDHLKETLYSLQQHLQRLDR